MANSPSPVTVTLPSFQSLVKILSFPPSQIIRPVSKLWIERDEVSSYTLLYDTKPSREMK
jgi:hypothetical protein